MITVLEYIHNKHIVHRDLKPDNFVVGLNELAKYLYLLDFGLAKKYRSSTTLKHYPLINKKKLTGTARYASINALRGYEQSRRDDLESAGYVLMYFLRGSLPWQGLHVNRGEDRYKKILQKKKGTSAEELCKGFPSEFVEYINYTRNLEFEADPDYKYLRGLLTSVLAKQNAEYDFYYDWCKEKPVVTDEFAIQRYTKNNTDLSLELPPEAKEKEDGHKSNNENEKENINIENYSGLKTDINTEDNNKIKYSKEVSKTDGDIIEAKNNDEININKGDKKDKKNKDKKNKKCNIM